MKLSRVPVFVSTAILLIVCTVSILLGVVDAEAASIEPPSPFKFEVIVQDAEIRIAVDKSSMFALLDKDDDLQVGGVFQILTNTAEGPKTFVNAVVAVCGYKGIIVIKGRMYNSAGILESVQTGPRSFTNISMTSTAGIIYGFLCGNPPQPTKSDPRYKAPERYNKFWT